MPERSREQSVAAIAAIDDPVRRRLFDLVSRSAEPISRDAAAAALDLSRSTAAFHLDRLAAEGLLATEFRRLSGRTGPGSGRPAKLYRRGSQAVSVSLPERRYDVAGDILATAVERSASTGEPVGESLRRAAFDAGAALGTTDATLDDALEAIGYEPARRPDGGTDLVNCPFHQLARDHTDLICAANVAFVEGVTHGCGRRDLDVVFAPAEGRCCVSVNHRDTSQELHS